MVTGDPLQASKSIQKQTGRTFYVATRLLPEAIRRATYVLYAFFRIADDIVDDPNPPSTAERRDSLRRIEAEALGTVETDDPIMVAFQDLKATYDISDREVEEFIAAMERDIQPTRYESYADLEDYLRGSSVAVAYMMLSVMDPDDPGLSRPHAKALGEAFQLTNFLRDVREDVQKYGRIYLPQETLSRHGVSEDQILALEFSEAVADVIRDELERTESLYRKGVDGIDTLPADCQFPVLTAAVLYADHHRLIRTQGYDVLSNRPTLTLSRRLYLVFRTWAGWRKTRDPRAVFDAVSPVPASPDASLTRTNVRPTRETTKSMVARPKGLLTDLVARLPLGVFR